MTDWQIWHIKSIFKTLFLRENLAFNEDFFLSSSGEKVETSPNPMATAPTDDSRESSPAEDEVILATAGYDHCIKFWTAHTGKVQLDMICVSNSGQLI